MASSREIGLIIVINAEPVPLIVGVEAIELVGGVGQGQQQIGVAINVDVGYMRCPCHDVLAFSDLQFYLVLFVKLDSVAVLAAKIRAG